MYIFYAVIQYEKLSFSSIILGISSDRVERKKQFLLRQCQSIKLKVFKFHCLKVFKKGVNRDIDDKDLEVFPRWLNHLHRGTHKKN